MRIGFLAGAKPEQIEQGREFRDRRALFRAISGGEIDAVATPRIADFARSFDDLANVLGELRANGVRLHVYHGGHDIGEQLQMVGPAFADFARAIAIARVHDGVLEARARGVKVGRPPLDASRQTIEQLLEAGFSKTAAAKQLGISRNTLYRRLRDE